MESFRGSSNADLRLTRSIDILTKLSQTVTIKYSNYDQASDCILFLIN